jgi:hypothetical protein
MEICRFNEPGMRRFGEFLDSLTTAQPEAFPILLLTAREYIEAIGGSTDRLDQLKLDDKLATAWVLDEIVENIGLDSPERDAGFWTWIACYLFTRLCPKTAAGDYRPGERARWIAEPANYQRYYRHLLAGVWHIYHAHSDEPQRTRALLSGSVNTPGEIMAQIASRVELVRNPVVMGLTRRLYWDDEKNNKKRGSGGSGSGSPRRLADILSQFEKTWDLFSMTVDELAGMLPKEFGSFLR